MNQTTKLEEVISLEVALLDTLNDYDLIIGFNDIVNNSLLEKFADTFRKRSIPISGKLNVLSSEREFVRDEVEVEDVDSDIEDDEAEYLDARQRNAGKSDIPSSHWFGNHEEDEDVFGNEPDIREVLGRDEVETTYENFKEKILPLITIEGSESFKEKMSLLCSEYHEIFSKKLKATPAAVPPMGLDVKEDQWKTARSRGSARRLSPDKLKELQSQINDMLESGVIRQSQELYHSQVLLIPKHDASFRLCIDYRFLNSLTTKLGWPLPNIRSIFERIGSIQPKLFGLVDLTKGYFQIALKEEAKKFTAFVTERGTYEWNRVSMGLTGAPSYFQQQIAETVLGDLIGRICEQYIDDILIYASSEEEFLERIECLFKRFREFNITLNPSKCTFGVRKITFLGHDIDQHGIVIASDKIKKVMDFPEPRLWGQLKSFIGVVNYFHQFIPNQSMILKPLNTLISNYSKRVKNKPVEWTEEGKNAFKQIKDLIFNCPKLYFLNMTDKIVLMTDASDYGVGAYLYQEVEGNHQPIVFLSRSLKKSELNWSTIEKEAYAIYYAITEIGYLLKGTPFTLLTDHANLTYISDSCSAKVIRWKLAIQEYVFTVRYIPGEKNFVADFLSRVPCEQEVLKEIEKAKDDLIISPIRGNGKVELLNSLLDDYRYTESQANTIKKYHNSTVGHFGVEKTLAKMKDGKENWQYMRMHVRRFLQHCPICQKMSEKYPIIVTKPYIVSNLRPMEQIQMDTIGPIKADSVEFNYILVIIDSFTRFVELYPTKSVGAEEYAKCLIKHIGRYGSPNSIRTDNGTQFVNKISDELCGFTSIYHELTHAGSKEDNSIVERSNKEVMRHIRAIIYDKGVVHDWVEYLPFVQRIMNASTHASIGVSPAQLLFGNAIDLDRGMLYEDKYDPKKGEENRNLSEVVEKLLHQQAVVLNIARKHQADINTTNVMSRVTGEEVGLTEFDINSYVLVKYKNQAFNNKPPSKLLLRWKGPMRVIDRAGSIYTLQNLATNQEELYHVSDMKRFEYDPLETDPRTVANRDYELVDVTEIENHRYGKKNKISTYEFKVKWEGFADPTWESWKTMRTNEKLHQYLSDKGLGKYIPKKFHLED